MRKGLTIFKSIRETERALKERGIEILRRTETSFSATLGSPFRISVFSAKDILYIQLGLETDDFDEGETFSRELRSRALGKFWDKSWSGTAKEIESGKYLDGESLEEGLERAAVALENIHRIWPRIEELEEEYEPRIDDLLKEAFGKIFS